MTSNVQEGETTCDCFENVVISRFMKFYAVFKIWTNFKLRNCIATETGPLPLIY